MTINQSLTANSVVMDFRAKRGAGSPSRPPLFSGRRLYGWPPTKITIIREDLVALTGNPFTAVVLNQLLYWTERLTDLDQLVKEELDSERGDSPRYGWFYKSSEELSEETLLGFDRRTIRRYLKDFMEKGWLSERPNPANKWDRTTQYRINIRQIYLDLREVGYDLPGFPLEGFQDLRASLPDLRNTSNTNTHNLQSTHQEPSKCRARTDGHSNAQQGTLECHSGGHSNVIQSALFNLTETTTEITNREHTERAHENLKILGEEKKEQVGSSCTPNHHLAESMVKVWEKHVASSPHLTQKRKQKLKEVLETHFQSDIAQWDSFCLRIKTSPFLMGKGSNGWRVSLDWILVEENLIKVLEGNFDDPGTQERALAMQANKTQEQRIKEILESIQDPVWREWCTEFTQGNNLIEPLCCFELESIANARFLEIEDDKLIWVGSTDQKVLNKIEDMRLRLSPLFTRLFPNVRTLRTRLIEEATLPTTPTTEGTESC
jgi:hypothetical protein